MAAPLLLLMMVLAARAAAEQPHMAVPPRPRSLAQAVVDGAPQADTASPGAPQPTALEPQVVRPEQVYYPTKDMLAAPSLAVMAGPLLNNASAAANTDSIEACGELCRATPGCDWFWYCSNVRGCQDGSGGTLAYQECQLRGEACMLPALGLSGNQVEVTSGFPTASVFGDASFRFTELQGQGIDGEDMLCDASMVPGKCVLPIAGEAVLICHAMRSICRAVTVYMNGLDGCSDSPVAVLKRAMPLPDNSWVSPHVSTLINIEIPETYPFFLYEQEATVQVPTEAELAANNASLAENGPAWWGCVSSQCVASGADVAVLDDVASPEDCCRACAERYEGTPAAKETGQPCNAWNYCERPDGCLFAGSSISPFPLRLAYRQCQLRYSFLSNITYGSPLIVAAKGNASEFSCGAPLSFWAPEIPGFTKMPGRGLFLYGNYNCTPSMRPGWDCAPPSPNLAELAQGCLDDPQCMSMPIKQGLPPVYGFYNASSSYRGYRKAVADDGHLLIVPTTNLYIPQVRAASSSGGSSLSTGAIVGIAVGATAAAAVLAGVAWAAIRRRRQRLGAAAPADAAALEKGKDGTPPSLDPASSGSSHLISKSSIAGDSSPRLSSATASRALPLPRQRSPRGGEGAPLAELLERVASVEAAAASLLGGTSPTHSEHLLLSADNLPPRLREFLVPPSAVTYCRWPNGQPQEIGVGATSRVFKAVLNGEPVAAKEIDLASSQLKQEAFITEALRLQQLRHPNVVALMGIALTPASGVLLLEYCEGRDLHSALDVLASGTHERLFGWYRRGRRTALEVARALNFLHSKGIVHLDVKSPNVLLTGNGTAKLADVGFSREKLHTFLSDLSNIGTFAWAAPEVLLAQQCTMKVDTYSFGVLLWEIVTGERPQRGQLRLPSVPQECPQAVCDLMLQCLHQDPDQRPTALELMQRLELLVGPPTHPPAVSGSAIGGGNWAPAPAAAASPPLRVTVPQPGMPSPFAALASVALPSQQQQWQHMQSPFTAQAAVALAAQQPQREQQE